MNNIWKSFVRSYGESPDSLRCERTFFCFSCCDEKYLCFHDIQDPLFCGHMFLFAKSASSMDHLFMCLSMTYPDENVAALSELSCVDDSRLEIGFVIVLPVNYDPALIALDLTTRN